MRPEDLEKVRSMQYRLSSLDERIIRIRSSMEYGQRQLDGMPRNHSARSRIDELMGELDELESHRICDCISLEREIEEVEKALSELPEKPQQALRLYYIDGLRSWQAVAEKMHYSERQCRRFRDIALLKAEKT